MDREKVMRALIDWNFWYKEQFTGHPREYHRGGAQGTEVGFRRRPGRCQEER